MKYRKLRIAWSVAGGVVCVLLIVLWVRSYAGEDRASGYLNSLGVRFYSSRGWIVCFKNNAIPPGQYPWSLELGSEYWLAAQDSRLKFASPGPFFSGSTTSHVSMPHWLVIGFASAMATVSWMHWRFSLRTLLIITTLVAVGLGLAVYAT